MKRLIFFICMISICAFVSSTVFASVQVKRNKTKVSTKQTQTKKETVATPAPKAVTTTQTAVQVTPQTKQDTGYLPESYYNSVSSTNTTTTSQPTVVTSPPKKAYKPQKAAVKKVKTNTVEFDDSIPGTDPEIFVEEDLSSSAPVPVAKNKVAKTKPLAAETQAPYEPKEYNTSYVVSEIGNLRQMIEEMKTGQSTDNIAGYDGGFFLKSKDGKFAFNINTRLQVGYAALFLEDFEDSHTLFIKRLRITFSGHAFSDKYVYAITFRPHKSPSLYNFEIGYEFHPAFNVYLSKQPVGQSCMLLSSGGMAFITVSMPIYRFDFGDAIGLSITGKVGWFSYAVAVSNGQGSGFAANPDNEMFYTGRIDFNLLGSAGSAQGDTSYSEKPVFTFGFGAAFGHFEVDAKSGINTQARIIGGAGDFRFKYKGFAVAMGGYYRQVDPDRFTRAQTDVGAQAYVSYFPIPKKLELALRGDVLFDDLTDAGNNLAMVAGGDTPYGPVGYRGAGDVDMDSANEYAGTFCIGYYFAGKRAKLQAEYKMVLDGVVGPDDRTYHIAQLLGTMDF